MSILRHQWSTDSQRPGKLKGHYRRLMQRRLNPEPDKKQYGQRWQVECTNSMLKRRLTTTVAARSYWAQCRELLLIVLTYQCMLVENP